MNVSFNLSYDQLKFYDKDMELITEPGIFWVMIGQNAQVYQ